MREIKFRAWDKVNEVMYLSYTPETQPKREYVLMEFAIGFSHYNIDDFVFMQFIGLQDKNNKNIYEGDIIKWANMGHDLFNVVEWKDHGFWLVSKEGECFMPNEREVVGNVFEHSHLLNK